MAEENAREGLLRSLDRIRASANRLETELMELHNIVRFDHRSESAKERASNLESELAHLATALKQFREHFEAQHAAR